MKFFLHEASPRWRCAAPCAAESGEAGASGRVGARSVGPRHDTSEPAAKTLLDERNGFPQIVADEMDTF
jgi:hypothetical protein